MSTDRSLRYNFFNLGLTRKAKLTIIYSFLLALLFILSYISPMDDKGVYVSIVIFLNLVGIAGFYLQFPLAGRFRFIALFNHTDWSIPQHKKMGYWIGAIFLLHPFLILAPKLGLSNSDAWLAIRTVTFAPEMLTGLIAWGLFIVWIGLSIFRRHIPIHYEIWRLWHSLGFIIISILATLHITSVGSHGQLQSPFNILFWLLCVISITGTVYNYLLKPRLLKQQPFEVKEIKKVSRNDWKLTLTSNAQPHFKFEAGQFVWLNSNPSPYNLDYHPFSIASTIRQLPDISFIIREWGDYTNQIGQLSIGQTVYVDGPFGQMSLKDSEGAKGIVLVAGGAGIAPMLSLLNQLADNQDPRPIRLLYGNTSLDQMVMQKEIKGLEQRMINFQQTLVCDQAPDNADVYLGVIDKFVLEKSLPESALQHWSAYLCGPEQMIDSVCKNLVTMKMSKRHIYFEQLAF
ncbi:ferredoxin reductase family protein [Aliiglaciecola sp. 3_MG-2023]|uniref:ferredoxin reductase family protein n=1 Tax=Aliiglaciecola sp. 3_MG-2023 TaxID=3062644 RepID=UPI0026E20800|nr:ferredoxin reductase family protein [Aliiglaciecola sp. 3_MG-2023]MDO6694785.1 ferredoxin reductase family protein [Aliiglaciecola sp. 3_MG-2023]